MPSTPSPSTPASAPASAADAAPAPDAVRDFAEEEARAAPSASRSGSASASSSSSSGLRSPLSPSSTPHTSGHTSGSGSGLSSLLHKPRAPDADAEQAPHWSSLDDLHSPPGRAFSSSNKRHSRSAHRLSGLPTVIFPLQGSGSGSEFAQSAPLWARYPWKALYYFYFGLSVGFLFLPFFAVASLFPSLRGRRSWSWKKATLIRLYRHSTRLTYRSHTSFTRDLSQPVPHSQTFNSKFVWVPALPSSLLRGEIARAMAAQGVSNERTCGFWFGARDGGGAVGQRAARGEKVVYHLHGGAYWIGTAHEKDISAAVSLQLLHKLEARRRRRAGRAEDAATPGEELGSPLDDASSSSSSSTPPASGSGSGFCRRTFSLDYRVCIPGHPERGSFPAALMDAVAGYHYLVKGCGFEEKNVVVVGDSAGGNLALALCRYLRDENTGMRVPGSMLLLSPWADTSRSHSGPLSAPNRFSSVFQNRATDIIPPCVDFRNTAVSALLGVLPAAETYRNAYLSSCSLHLDVSAPDWGYAGFPKRVYITTGDAEVSYDQHLTLAHRLAAGTRRGRPVYVGDRISEGKDARALAERREYPRPRRGSIPAAEMGEGKEQGEEERTVWLDEKRDAVHDYLLFNWWGRERDVGWERIAAWLEADE